MKRYLLTLLSIPFLTFSGVFAQSNCQADFVLVDQCPYFEFIDTSSATSTIVDWYYDFGDGGTSNSPNPVYTYNANGTYLACLYITTADSCTSMICDSVVVDCLSPTNCIDPALIDTTVMCPQVYDPVCGCDSITYNNSCDAVNYGGVTSYTPGPCSQQAACNAEFEINDSISQCPSFQFIDISTGNFQVSEWVYDFGDGTSSNSQNPYHTYQANGTYTVCLYITTLDSCTSWFCDQITVGCLGQQNDCEASFVVDDSVNQCPTYQFYDLSTSTLPIGDWYYDFGDGFSSQSQNPTHTYQSNGTYTVCLYITSADSCTSSYCETIYVNCLAGIDELNKFDLKISPNPATNSFALNLGDESEIGFKIYNLNGRVFDSGRRMSAVQHQFDVSELARGMYLLEVVFGDSREVIRFVKE